MLAALIFQLIPMTERKHHLDLLAYAILLTCSFLWGGQQVLVKATMVELDPVFQAAVRFLGATLILMGWCWYRKIPLWGSDGSLKVGLVAGVLFAIEFAFIFQALQFTTASKVTVFAYTSPFWVALLVPVWVPTEKIRKWQWFGLALAFLGVAIALADGLMGSGSDEAWIGDLMALAGGFFWGMTTVVIRTTMLTKISAEKLLFYQLGVSALLMPLVSLALGETWKVTNWSLFAFNSLMAQIILGAFLSILAWMWLLGRYPATKVSAFVFFTPIFALVFGAWWLNEPVTFQLVLGMALVACGIVLVNRQ
jgi:drug/metabolite transporter (DMT)-like permease